MRSTSLCLGHKEIDEISKTFYFSMLLVSSGLDSRVKAAKQLSKIETFRRSFVEFLFAKLLKMAYTTDTNHMAR